MTERIGEMSLPPLIRAPGAPRSTEELVSELMARDVRVWAEGDRLRLSAPKGVLTDELQAELSGRKDEILAFLRMARAAAEQEPPPIEPAPREGKLPLSFGQERLWFLEQLDPGNTAYHIPMEIRFARPLDLRALERSLEEIVRRHEILRTRFPASEGEPLMVVEPFRDRRLAAVSLEALSEAARERELARLRAAQGEEPFDLERGPLWRALLVRIGERDHRLLVTQHHIITDRWSLGLFVQELKSLYAALASGGAVSLPERAVQYADYARWQREWLKGEILDRQLSYWEKQLRGPLPLVELPLDRPRPATQTHSGSWESRRLPRSLADRLKELSRREGGTLYMTLLAAFQTLVHRYTGLEDVLVGSPVAGRNRRELETMMGFFVNTVVLRSDLSGDPPFRELLRRVRRVALEAFAHQDLPFEKLVEELRPERNLSLNPLFQLMIALQNAPMGDSIDDVSFTASGGSMMDLTFYLVDSGAGLVATAEYNADLFDRSTVARLLESYECLLEDASAHPERRLSALRLMSPEQERRVLREWNETSAPFPRDRCLHHLVDEQAGRTPEAVALVCGDEELTYAELERRANRLARYLQKRGVGPEMPVGVCLRRSPDMVVALLGIMKAGGAYVPLDPSYPKDRLRFMIADSKARVVVTEERTAPELPEGAWERVSLDADAERIAREEPTAPLAAVAPENLIYVLYTSGSTGRPKGVAIAHRSAVALVAWAQEVFGPEELSGVLASTSINFDLSVFEMFLPLSRGGTAILVENALELPRAPRAGAVRLVNTVPSAIAELLRVDGVPDSVTTVCLAGEPLPASLVREVLARTRARRVLDLYGPSEDTTYSTFAERSADAPPTIGRPLRNTQVFILDGRSQPVPVGVPGELCLSGEGLARGYLGRPDQTAERFVPHPFSDKPGDRLYRTGDLARFRPDGDIEFLGRKDHQVKLRGFRIELGEIEQALLDHEAVRAAVVLVKESGPGDRHLVAYVACGSGAAPTVTELRGHVREKLPAYMIPSMFVTLDALPLTPNGKIDRRALAALEDRAGPRRDLFVAPRTEMERSIAAIWEELLKVERIGIHDNFFDLGGHSLLSMRVIARLEKRYGIRLGVRELMFQTLEQCAASCEELRGPVREPRARGVGRRWLDALRQRW